ncbi:MAG: amino acid adenylation domain-containing protein, partial [Chroococcales cyanobacterium]
MRSHPNGIALVSEQASLTYTELNQRANSLADLLQQMGVKPNALVGLCVERSADMVIGILGILKAGGAYVPLDPNYPSDRLQFMLSDTNVSILLTQSALVQKLPRSQARILCLDQPYPSLHNEKTENATITPNNLAYVIYTSGSTGTPKGVLLSHRGLSNVVAAQHQTFSPCRNSRILQFSSLSFDASIFEIALALGSGSTLYIPPKSAQLPGVKLIQFLRDNAISHALLTPAVLAVLPSAELPHLKVLITGGEACSRQVLDRWATHRHFFNAYGPTETSIWATVTELSPGDNPLIIGRPILNTEVYILDHSLNPVPVGIPGELYIGGIGLAQGYLHRAELTTERFINVELPNGKVTRLYKTGDRVLYHPNGNLEFLGRTDFQIKIRGFRIELGEIEATLQRHPAIREAVAIPLEKKSSKTRLIAYFSLNKQYFQQILLESLQSQHIESWQTLYNQTYQAEIANSQFNITGWNSSYTGEPIPMKEMQEWVSDRVQQILAFKPQRVLEIGCGTGLLLFQIAPHTQQYVGTDFSKVSLAFIENQLESLNLPQVTLMQRMATDFDGMNPGSFDVVILNSIVQYFPSEHYLIEVIAKAIERVAEGGVLFLGDLRSLPLLNAFHTWMKFSQAEAGMERDFLKKQGMRSQFEEAELAIDPAFFYALQNKFPQIKQVQIRLSRGRSQNEMTQFRYNVLLYIKQSQEHQSTVNNNVGGFHSSTQTKQFNTPLSKGGRGDSHNWQLTPVTVKEIQQKLIETRPEIFIINNIPNSRINAAVKTANWLKNQEPPKTVGRMRELLEKSPEITIDPQDWWDLETVLPYTVEITWSTPTHTGNYDVLFLRDDVKETVNFSSLFPQNLSNPPYTNDPLQSEFAR